MGCNCGRVYQRPRNTSSSQSQTAVKNTAVSSSPGDAAHQVVSQKAPTFRNGIWRRNKSTPKPV